MKISTVVESKSVDAMFKKLKSQFSKDIKKELLATTEKAITMIEDRTAKGKGYSGRFKPYSKEYAIFRSKKGRQTRFVDLNFKGTMLGAMKSKIDQQGSISAKSLIGEISFTRATEAKKAMFNNQKRPFFGFNKREKDYLRKFFYKRLTK